MERYETKEENKKIYCPFYHNSILKSKQFFLKRKWSVKSPSKKFWYEDPTLTAIQRVICRSMKKNFGPKIKNILVLKIHIPF